MPPPPPLINLISKVFNVFTEGSLFSRLKALKSTTEISSVSHVIFTRNVPGFRAQSLFNRVFLVRLSNRRHGLLFI